MDVEAPGGGAAAERQDPAVVREAARACLAAGAPLFALAMMAIAVRRSGATAADWALIVRALLAPEAADRLEGADALAELCLRSARAGSPGDPEIERLRTDVAAQLEGMTTPYRTAMPAPADLVPHLFDALESAAADLDEALFAVPPETQDVLVTELGDEAEPRTATLVASILRTDVNPALHCFLLDSVAVWAAHPDIRDAARELGDSGRRELLEPSITEALGAIERARDTSLKYRPSGGRSARREIPGRSKGARAVEAPRGVVFEGAAYRRSSAEWVTAAVLLVLLLGLVFYFIAWGLWMSREEGSALWLGVGIGGVAAVVITGVVRVRASRARHRIVATEGGARFELDDGPRGASLPFPLDYQAACHLTKILVGRRTVDVVVLQIVILDEEGRAVLGFEERLGELETPPPDWTLGLLELPPEATYQRAFGRIHLDALERELARWCRETRAAA